MKRPAFQFYPADWRKDPSVQSLSFFERGVWFEILCLMHESEHRGKLLLNGKKMPEEALSRLLGLDKQNLTKVLTTLIEYGVASIDDETGALISRRMVRDERLIQIRAESGKKGGNPALLKQKSTKEKKEVNHKSKQNPTPSSSSSTSVTSSKDDVRPTPPPRYPGERVKPYLPLDELKAIVMADRQTEKSFVQVYYRAGLPPDRLSDWLDAFHSQLIHDGESMKQEKDYRKHFAEWIKFQPYTKMNPKDFSPVKAPVQPKKQETEPAKKWL